MCPLDYSLCSQTVTVYRLSGGQVHRKVFTDAFYQHWMGEKHGTAGRVQETGCLVIIPGCADLQPGDRVCPGVGPEVTASQWTGFLPVHVSGLSQIAYVKPCFFEGVLCHTEAGRKKGGMS